MKKILFLLSTAVFFTACATGKKFQNFEIANDKKYGTLYVYRPSGFVGLALSYDILLGEEEKLIGVLKNGSFIKKDLPIGNYLIKTTMGPNQTINIEIKENEVSCVRSFVTMGVFSGNANIIGVTKDICEQEIIETNEANHKEQKE